MILFQEQCGSTFPFFSQPADGYNVPLGDNADLSVSITKNSTISSISPYNTSLSGMDYNTVLSSATSAAIPSLQPNLTTHIAVSDSFDYGNYRKSLPQNLKADITQFKIDGNPREM